METYNNTITNLYNFFTDTNSYSAVGTNVYDAIWGIITWHPELTEIEKIERTDLSSGQTTMMKPEIIKAINVDILQKSRPLILTKGLTNVGGFSCFMDSLIFPLLLKDGYFKEKLLNGKNKCPEVQTSLIEIYKNIEKNSSSSHSPNSLSCIPLVKAMKNCNLIKEFATGEQQDESEFLIALMDLYDLSPTKVNERIYLSNDKRKWKNIKNLDINEAVLEIQPELNEPLKIYQASNLEDYSEDPDNMPKDDDNNRYKYKYSAIRIINSECIIIHVKRRFLGRKDTTPIIISKTLKDESSDRYYNLEIITFHTGGYRGGHYRSFFRWGIDWYLYDDLSENIKLVDWNLVKEIAGKNGSLLIYY